MKSVDLLDGSIPDKATKENYTLLSVNFCLQKAFFIQTTEWTKYITWPDVPFWTGLSLFTITSPGVPEVDCGTQNCPVFRNRAQIWVAIGQSPTSSPAPPRDVTTERELISVMPTNQHEIYKILRQFLPFMVRQLMSKLKDSGIDIDEEYVKRTAREFYKTSREYLEQWTSFLTKKMETFYWADLKRSSYGKWFRSLWMY